MRPEELRDLVKKIHDYSAAADAPDLKVTEFEDAGEPRDVIAVDGSYTFLFNISSTWIGVVRACALHFGAEDSRYVLRRVHLKEEPLLVSRNEELMKGDETLHKLYLSSQPHGDEFERRIINSYRALLEERLACEIASQVSRCTVAMDGALYDRGFGSLSELAEVCRHRSNTLLGVSKDSTTHMFGSLKTDEELLADLKAEKAFVKARNQKDVIGVVYFVKLHPDAGKWFRIDVCSTEDPNRVFSDIAKYSRSELCLGYPFPLLEAHRLAVAVRHFQELYENEVLKAAMELGMPVGRALENMTKWEGERRGAFHEYLDKLARSMR